jgi:nitrate reductase gamma subunit
VTARKLLLRIAIGLLLVEGGPIAFIGFILTGASVGSAASRAAPPIGFALFATGVASIVGATGLLARRTWGWPVAATSVVVGLLAIVLILLQSGARDGIVGAVVLMWSITFACLLAGAPDRPLRGRTSDGSETLNEP